MKVLLIILLAFVLFVSGCTQNEITKKYKYTDLEFQEPSGWDKVFPLKQTLSDGQTIGPDDILFVKNNKAIYITRGGSLEEFLEKAREHSEVKTENRSIGKYNGVWFSIESKSESFMMEGFSFEKKGESYFITVSTNDVLSEDDVNTFTNIVESIN